jgi:hypothetical protein
MPKCVALTATSSYGKPCGELATHRITVQATDETLYLCAKHTKAYKQGLEITYAPQPGRTK